MANREAECLKGGVGGAGEEGHEVTVAGGVGGDSGVKDDLCSA